MAQSDIYGLRKAVTKQIDLTIPQYDGTAKDGEIIVDMNPGNTQYQIFIGTEAGDVIGLTASFANTANFAANVTGAAQPNITSVGTLIDLAVAGNATIGANLDVTGLITGSDANLAGNLEVGTDAIIAGEMAVSGLITGGSGADITGDVSILGNLSVDGDITYINVTDLQVQDPIIFLGGGPNGAPLTGNDGKDRGTQLQVYDTGVAAMVPKFMGWDNSAAQFILGSNVTNTSDVITVNTYGNLRLDTLSGANISVTGNVSGFNVSASNSVSATANISAGGNVNATGNVVATGNVAGGNVTTGGQVVATGNVVSSANVNGVNINASGNVAATGNVSGQNIAATANLSSGNLTVTTGNVDFTTTANVSLGAVGNVKITGGSLNHVLITNGAGALSFGVPSQSNAVQVTATATAANFNVLFTGSGGGYSTPSVDSEAGKFVYNPSTNRLFVENANISGITNLGAVGNVVITGGVSGQVLRTDGTGVLSWVDANTAPGGAGANTQVIFNDAGVLGAASTFTYNKLTDILSVGNVSLTANLSVGGEVLTDLIPNGNKVYDLGNATNRWGNIYLSNNSLYLGAVHVTSDDVSVVNIPNVAVAGNVVAANIVTTSTNVNFSNATTFTVGANTSLSGTGLQSDVFISRADTAATSTLNCGTADYFKYTVSGATTFTATNVPAAGRLCSILLEVVNGGSAAITWFSGTKWASATPPTLTAAGTDVLGFFTTDGGTSWTGLVLGLNIS